MHATIANICKPLRTMFFPKREINSCPSNYEVNPARPVHFWKLYWNKKFLFAHFFVVPQKVLWRPLRPYKTFWGTTKKCKNKNFNLIFSPHPGLGRGLKLTHYTKIDSIGVNEFISNRKTMCCSPLRKKKGTRWLQRLLMEWLTWLPENLFTGI